MTQPEETVTGTLFQKIICKMFHRDYKKLFFTDKAFYKYWYRTECGKCGRVLWDRWRDQPSLEVDSSKMLKP